jgi:hypothetical protein
LEDGRWILTLIHSVCLLVHDIINAFRIVLALVVALLLDEYILAGIVQKWGKLLHRDFRQKRASNKPRTKQQTNLSSQVLHGILYNSTKET